MANVFDNATAQPVTRGSLSYSFSHTVTASPNRILFVIIHLSGATAGSSLGAPTYNGVAMTRIETVDFAAGTQATAQLFYLVNPDLGANDVSYNTENVNYDVAALAVSYYGVAQTAPDVHFSADASGGLSYNNSITTTITNDWVLAFLSCVQTTSLTQGTNVLQRVFSSTDDTFKSMSQFAGDSNSAVSPPQSYNQSINATNTLDHAAFFQVAFSPSSNITDPPSGFMWYF